MWLYQTILEFLVDASLIAALIVIAGGISFLITNWLSRSEEQ